MNYKDAIVWNDPERGRIQALVTASRLEERNYVGGHGHSKIDAFRCAGLCEIGGGYLSGSRCVKAKHLVRLCGAVLLYGVIPTYQPQNFVGFMPRRRRIRRPSLL